MDIQDIVKLPALRSHLSRFRPVAVLLGIMLLSLAVSSYKLSSLSIGNDEGVSIGIASMPVRSAMAASKYEPNMVLYYALLHLWLLIGNSETTVRFLSVLSAMAAIGLTVVAAKHWFGQREAIFAGLLLAFNAYFISYAQQARSYALLTFLVVLAMLCAHKAIVLRRPRQVMMVAVIGAVAFYVHVFSVFIMGAIALVLLLMGIRPLLVGAASLVYGILTLPMWVVGFRAHHYLLWIPKPSASYLLFCGKLLTGNCGLPLVLAYGCLVTAFIVMANRTRRPAYLLLSGWALLPAMALLSATVVHPLFYPRYLVMSLPALAIMAAVVIGKLPRVAAPMVFGIMLSLAICGCLRSYGKSLEGPPDDMRSAAAFIGTHADVGDRVVVYWAMSVFAFQYYAKRWHSAPPVVFPNLSSPESALGNPRWDLTGLASGRGLWFVETASDSHNRAIYQLRMRACSGGSSYLFGSVTVRLCR